MSKRVLVEVPEEVFQRMVSVRADIAPEFVIFYVEKRGWASMRLGFHEGIGPYFSLPEALRRAEREIGEMVWRPHGFQLAASACMRAPGQPS